MLVKCLAISLLCLAVNAGKLTERRQQLADILLCACDADDDLKISPSEIDIEINGKQLCKKVLEGFLITTDWTGTMNKEEIVKGLKKKKGQFSKVKIGIKIKKNDFIAPDKKELEDMEEIVSCSSDNNNDGIYNYAELVDDNRPVFNLVKLFFNMKFTQEYFDQMDCAGDGNGLLESSELLDFLKYVYIWEDDDAEFEAYEKKLEENECI